jgi:hypothetical protein
MTCPSVEKELWIATGGFNSFLVSVHVSSWLSIANNSPGLSHSGHHSQDPPPRYLPIVLQAQRG